MCVTDRAEFYEEEAAYAVVEAHLWPDGPSCPRCGERARVNKMNGKSLRQNVYKCYSCRKPFNVKIVTVFEQSNVPMTRWLQAIFLLNATTEKVSVRYLKDALGVSLKTAWIMSQRLNELKSDATSSASGNRA